MTNWLVDYNTKIPIIPSLYDPRYNISFTSNKTGFPLKYCGNDDGGVPNVWNLYTILTFAREFSLILLSNIFVIGIGCTPDVTYGAPNPNRMTP